MRRVLVTASRKWVARTTIWNALSSELVQFPSGIVVVHGGAEGGDDIADRWAWGMKAAGHNVHVEVHRPDYHRYAVTGQPCRERFGKAFGHV